ncbi:MAG: AAA family ATPase, partial [Planctomycetes bacterium]|nr:AAA family ATPase [Planctomycetota bacterium]
MALGEGLTVLTGETGVGKTMLLDALGALRGERARADLLRSGAEEGFVRGSFKIEDAALRERLSALASPVAAAIGDEISIERIFRASGRHVARMDGAEVSLAALARIGALLFEIQGQRSQLALLDPAHQLASLDRFAGLAAERAAFRAAYDTARALAAKIDRIAGAGREREERHAFLAHVVRELEQAALVRGERGELSQELALLEERDSILQEIREARESLYEAEGSALDRVAGAARAFAPRAELHAGLAEFAARLDAARIAIDDAVRALRGVEEALEQDSGRIETARERFHQWMLLEERY